jgi:hypothetical protein
VDDARFGVQASDHLMVASRQSLQSLVLFHEIQARRSPGEQSTVFWYQVSVPHPTLSPANRIDF